MVKDAVGGELECACHTYAAPMARRGEGGPRHREFVRVDHEALEGGSEGARAYRTKLAIMDARTLGIFIAPSSSRRIRTLVGIGDPGRCRMRAASRKSRRAAPGGGMWTCATWWIMGTALLAYNIAPTAGEWCPEAMEAARAMIFVSVASHEAMSESGPTETPGPTEIPARDATPGGARASDS